MSTEPIKQINSQDWLRQNLSTLPPTVVNVLSGDPDANRRPLLVLVPGFLADAPSMTRERLQRKMGEDEIYKASAWEAVAQDLISKVGCEVSIFSWPYGGIESAPLSSEELITEILVPVIAGYIVGPLLAYHLAKWKRALQAADRTYLLVSSYVRDELQQRPSVLVVGHSLGGRIALNTAYDLRVAGERQTDVTKAKVISLAPAIGPNAIPAGAYDMVEPIADVGWSAHDRTLKRAFGAVQMSEGPALGLKPVDALKSAIDFHDVSSIVPGRKTRHSTYTRQLYSYIERLPQGQAFMAAVQEWHADNRSDREFDW